MYSRMVARQLEEAKEIALAFGKSSGKAAMALERRFSPDPADPLTIDFRALLDALGQDLIASAERLAELDREGQVELLLEKQSRERRDLAMSQLRDQLKGARFLLDQAFGKAKASSLFPDRARLSRLPPRHLLALAKSIAQVLRGAEVEWPPLERESHLPRREELAAGLESAALELEAQLAALAPERAASVFTRGSKNAAFLASRRTVSSATQALTGLFRLAGFEYAARRLGRPRKRGPGKVEAEPSAPPRP